MRGICALQMCKWRSIKRAERRRALKAGGFWDIDEELARSLDHQSRPLKTMTEGLMEGKGFFKIGGTFFMGSS